MESCIIHWHDIRAAIQLNIRIVNFKEAFLLIILKVCYYTKSLVCSNLSLPCAWIISYNEGGKRFPT